MNKKGGAAHDRSVAYLGRYPFRSGVTCADFDSEGRLIKAGEQVELQGQLVGEVGQATVDIFHNCCFWVMFFAEGQRHNRLILGQDKRQLTRLRDAFERALFGFHSQFPIVMVGGVAFNVFEARAMRDLLARVLAA